jgi:hypothetical protein
MGSLTECLIHFLILHFKDARKHNPSDVQLKTGLFKSLMLKSLTLKQSYLIFSAVEIIILEKYLNYGHKLHHCMTST